MAPAPPAPVHLPTWPVSVGPRTAPAADPPPNRHGQWASGLPRRPAPYPGHQARPTPAWWTWRLRFLRQLHESGTAEPWHRTKSRTPDGGNKPKPGTTSGGNGGQSAKDRSRAQSRPVSGKAPAGRSGKASANSKTGGNKPKPKPGGRPAAAPAPAPGVRGHDGLGSGRTGGRDHRGAGHREGQQQLEQQHRLYTGHRRAGLGGARRDQHPRVRLQHRRASTRRRSR